MKKIITCIYLIIVLLIVLIFYYINYDNKEELSKTDKCPVVTKEVLIDGTSLSPFINSGDRVIALYDYYNCHDVLRNDVVLYDYSGNKNLLIKFVRAIPGDSWELKKIGNEYEIIINGITLLNYEGLPYLFTENTVKLLKLYANDYPIIPKDTYLLLGDKISGSMDSTKFGLVNKKEIVAKVKIGDN